METYIPTNYIQELAACNEELAIATKEYGDAEKRYRQAIISRINILELIRNREQIIAA